MSCFCAVGRRPCALSLHFQIPRVQSGFLVCRALHRVGSCLALAGSDPWEGVELIDSCWRHANSKLQ